jgi:Tol biopolymer transport system component
MMQKQSCVLLFISLFLWSIVACSNPPPEPTPAMPSQAIVVRTRPPATETPIPTLTATSTTVPTATPSPTPTVTPVPPSPTPVPDEIVFQSNRSGYFQIYIVALDGSNLRQLTFTEANNRYPRVSPNGRYITFESERDGGDNTEIYIMNRDGSEQRRLTFHLANDRLPTFSPDSQRIVFASERSGVADLYIINIDGSGLQLVAETPLREGHPSWSVNDQLVYNASLELFWQIYTSDLDGRNRRQLTNSRVDEWSPEWSPDGSRIVFLSERVSRVNPGIYVMDADGGNVRLVYDGPQYEWGAVWSGDGSQILFTEDQPDGTADLFIINSDGTNLRRILQRGSYPSWANAIREE